jgi:predicted DNA-binding protein (MmcQ/YjbR family)
MNHELIRELALSLPEVTEGLPFDQHSLVFKVHGKLFAILSLDSYPPRINLKNDPDLNLELRDQHPYIIPGYHMNKQHWNTIIAEEYADWDLIQGLIQTSYQLVWQKLPKKVREDLR